MDAGQACLPDITMTDQAVREPVPGWLADPLIHTVGLSREAVAALDLQQAVEAWAEYRSGLR